MAAQAGSYGMLTVANLSKEFGATNKVQALKSVNLEVGRGEIVGFVGLNGAGKTTTIKIVAGVIRPTSGSVSVEGLDAFADHERAAEFFSWVPENPIFDLSSDARSWLLDISKFGSKEVPASRVDDVLARVGLGDKGKVKLKAYSLGMKRRLTLAQAFLEEPQLLLMDEAMNGLDPEGMHFFRETVRDFRNRGGAVLLSSHVLTEISGVSDRVSFIHKGTTFDTKTIDELKQEFQASHGGSATFEVQGLAAADLDEIGKLSGGRALYDGRLLDLKTADESAISGVNRYLVNAGRTVTGIRRAEFNLEQLFLDKVREADGRPGA
jgi:ABC-2 type transport system ATP-binding protein